MRIPSVITSGELLSRIRYHWDELIAYLRATRLVAGNGISISEHPTGTIISVNPQPTGGAGSAGSSGYNGYFKIVDITDYTASPVVYKVMVVDGATFDPVNKTSSPSIAKVSGINRFYNVLAWQSSSFSTSQYIYLQYSSSSDVVSVVMSSSYPQSEPTGTAYYPIGRAVIDGNALSIAQQHTSGIAEINYTPPDKCWFQIVKNGNVYRVVNGFYPQTSVAGYTDIPDIEEVPAQDLSFSVGNVYLNFVYDQSNQTYSCNFASTGNGFYSVRIANIKSDGVIEQFFTSSTVYVGRLYFL